MKPLIVLASSFVLAAGVLSAQIPPAPQGQPAGFGGGAFPGGGFGEGMGGMPGQGQFGGNSRGPVPLEQYIVRAGRGTAFELDYTIILQ